MDKRTLVDPASIHYVPVGRIEEFNVRVGRTIRVNGKELAVFHTSDGRLFALDDINPCWRGGRLSEGIVSGHDVYDSLCDKKINLDTGQGYPAETGLVQTYPVYVEDAEVQIGLPANH
jgi:nitrite reductase (NADH) small subunit